MGTYQAALDLADQIRKDTGLVVAVDIRDVHPPCLLIAPPKIDVNRFCGGNATFKILVIVPGPWNADGWKAADGMLAKLLQSDAVTIESVSPDKYLNPDGTTAGSVFACDTTVAVSL